MLKATYVCDLCRKEYSYQMGHASHKKINDNKTVVKGTDSVNFPPGWVGVGVNIVCGDCLLAVSDEALRLAVPQGN